MRPTILINLWVRLKRNVDKSVRNHQLFFLFFFWPFVIVRQSCQVLSLSRLCWVEWATEYLLNYCTLRYDQDQYLGRLWARNIVGFSVYVGGWWNKQKSERLAIFILRKDFNEASTTCQSQSIIFCSQTAFMSKSRRWSKVREIFGRRKLPLLALHFYKINSIDLYQD